MGIRRAQRWLGFVTDKIVSPKKKMVYNLCSTLLVLLSRVVFSELSSVEAPPPCEFSWGSLDIYSFNQ